MTVPARRAGATPELSAAADPLWQADVGYAPHKVTVLEMVTRGRALYLRWRETTAKGRNWRYESLNRTLYDADGKRLKGRALGEVTRWATDRAKEKYHALVAGLSPAQQVQQQPLTIREAWAKVSDKMTGLYPVETHHTREVKRALDAAVRVWKGDTPWSAIGQAKLTELGRARVDELRAEGRTGYRGAEATVARVLTVAQWLRDQELIPRDACVPARRWKEDLKVYWAQSRGVVGAPEPSRPRYTRDEMLALLRVAPEIDPRFALLVALGAELRLGQVRRGRRSDLALQEAPGTFTVKSNRHKRGTVVMLTDGQRAAVDEALRGYLRLLEAQYQTDGTDYPLFPAGKLVRFRYEGEPTAEPGDDLTTIDTTAIRKWWRAAEDRAAVTYVAGRGWYGVRRRAVDEFKRLGGSKEALQQHGGWSSTAMPDQVYADREAEYAREEARDVRAKIRGETL